VFDEDELTEKFSVAELQAKVDALEVDMAEAADPATGTDGDPEPSVQSGGGDPETAALSAAERKEKEELEQQIEQQEARLAETREDSMPHSLAKREKERLESELEELEA
jgi:preprotein translocase subunit SecD